MNKLMLSIAAGMILFSACQTVALADPQAGSGSYRIDKNSLEQVKPFQARRQLQIVDEDPILNDLRRRPQAANKIIVNVAPLAPEPGKTFVYGDPQAGGSGSGVIPLSSQNPNLNSLQDLPDAGFTRYFNPNKFQGNRNLPNGQTIGMHPTTGTPVAQRTVNGKLHPGTSPLTAVPQIQKYANYTQAVGGYSSGGTRVKTDATGKLINSPLLGKLSKQ